MGMRRGFSKSGKMAVPQMSDKRFSDVVGCDEAKEDLKQIVQYLESPQKFTRLGGKLPKGVLLLGPPGTGKTLLARAIAGEAGVPFFYTSGSEFDEMFVGVGARRVRDLFKAAKQHSPCIIFIDEMDAVGGKRNAKDQQAMKMTLNQLLVELDGFEQNQGIIVIGATNFSEALDPALVRPGRFDNHISVGLPDVRGRNELIKHYLETISTVDNAAPSSTEQGNVDQKSKSGSSGREIDSMVLARGTPGASGADLANLINAAALRASSLGDECVTMKHLEYAKDKILMGSERLSAYISPETQKLTAYHEGGHATVALHTRGANPVHMATIMPRGRALGLVLQLPEGDQKSQTRQQMLAEIDVCMGGRVAEELVFGEDNVTSGASSDLQRATMIARRMVMYYGMGSKDKVGVVRYDAENMESLSPETREAIDKEVKDLLDSSYKRAKNLLIQRRGDLETIAKALLKHETLSGEELKMVLQGKEVKVGA